jgi:acyl carrier protein phosphodiesterase
MNFLAHLFLTQHNEDWLIGNMIADFIRNKDLVSLSDGIREGVMIHRKIDTLTDNHALVRQGTRRIQPHFHKYAPVIVDVYYDFLLANQWKHYTTQSLRDFTDQTYAIFHRRWHDIPPAFQPRLERMIAHDWLMHYGEEEGLRYTFERLEKRLQFPTPLDQAVDYLIKDLELFTEEFNRFFPEMIETFFVLLHPK